VSGSGKKALGGAADVDDADDADLPSWSTLYVSEKECARRIGIGADKWHDIALTLEKSGLPKRDPLFCGRRYWPKVRRFLDEWNGIHPKGQFVRVDQRHLENWDALHAPRKKKARSSDAHSSKGATPKT
jgi:hypothetical protein